MCVCVQLQWQAKAAMLAGANVFIVDGDCTLSYQPNNKHEALHSDKQAAQVGTRTLLY